MAAELSSPSKSEDSWRQESDYQTLMRAAEVMADKVRMAGAMRYMDKTRKAEACMEKMLTNYRKTGKMGKGSY